MSFQKNLWLTSDLHLGHVNAATRWRGFDTVEDMNETLIDNWNRVVNPNDAVWILGDIVMGARSETLPLVNRLHGNKVLVPGNHDYVHPCNGDKMVAKWWQAYADRFSLITSGQVVYDDRVTLCHFPYTADHTDKVRYPEYRPTDKGGWLLHGHIHGTTATSPDRPRQIDVGVDAHGFTPVAWETLIEMMKP